MIAVDSSALVAIVLKEPLADRCKAALSTEPNLLMSAVVLAEVSIVAQSRGFDSDIRGLVEGLNFQIVPADVATAAQVSQVYKTWGKGNHPARLNLVDCFSYVLARQNNCPLLFVGDDFSQTDITSAL